MSIAITANAPEAHIQRTSRFAAAIVAFFIVATPLALALYVASGALIHHPWLTLISIPSTALGPAARIAIFVASLAAIAPWMWGLWELRRLFLGYANGAVFTQQAAVHFGNFAMSLVLAGVAAPVAVTLLSLMLSALGVMVPGGVVISFSSNEIFAILLGALLRIIASVLRAAARLAEENASFV